MRRARFLTLISTLVLAAGCESGASLSVDGTITSLSPSSSAHPTLLALMWLYFDGKDDSAESGGGTRVPGSLPASFGFSVEEPGRYYVDFEALKAIPSCSSEPVSLEIQCWPREQPRPKGSGKLGLGTFAAFEDVDGDGRFTQKPQREPLRGWSPLFLLYARDLDADAIAQLGEWMVVNPQAIRPGFNFARVRCKDKVGWTKDRFDPFEIVSPESITVESREAIDRRIGAGELCANWT